MPRESLARRREEGHFGLTLLADLAAEAGGRLDVDSTPGRIPGARNAPWNEPQPELPDGELVAYCGSGVTACVVLHRAYLRGRCGLLYPGSWSDWSNRSLPVERD